MGGANCTRRYTTIEELADGLHELAVELKKVEGCPLYFAGLTVERQPDGDFQMYLRWSK